MSEQRSEDDQAHADAYELLISEWLTLPEAALLAVYEPVPIVKSKRRGIIGGSR